MFTGSDYYFVRVNPTNNSLAMSFLQGYYHKECCSNIDFELAALMQYPFSISLPASMYYYKEQFSFSN